jgi:hypothetical protein
MNVEKVVSDILKISKKEKVEGLMVRIRDAKNWAKKFWDTYGFDYLIDSDPLQVFIWPLENSSIIQLKNDLEKDGIQNREFTKYLEVL